jgi:exopolysaccharide biosynthesis polyprenyl glycosylphosphotransferase
VNDWAQRYAARLLVTDVVVIVWAVFGSELAWFGTAEANVEITGRLSNLTVSYTAVSVALSLAWIFMLTAAASRDSRIVGIGTTEYRRVINSSLMLFGLVAIAAYLSKSDLARGYFITALPIGLLALVLSRWMWRQHLTARRAEGEMSAQVVLVGSFESAASIAQDLVRTPQAGYAVLGAFVPATGIVTTLPGSNTPILGTIDDVIDRLDSTGADTVVVTSSDELPPERLRQLSWSLEPGRQHLVVAPGLIDVAGPRIHMRPVAGLPLIHVETPRYEGSRQTVKRVFDVVATILLLLLLSVPFAAAAIAIRLSSEGPIFFRQERVGINGRRFRMLKFRSMVTDAEARLAELKAAERTEGNAVMFKMADDPRVTPIGRILRRFSIDELPQLINVLLGDMSLVGPRPPLPSEVEAYEHHVNRRFLVTPGVTGLWQVSGRSSLDWESTVRLDLFYVENWSLTGDLVILWRTVRAVLRRDGAY